MRHGQGTYTFRDGSVYTGEWKAGKYHGQGECRWADGRVYRGELDTMEVFVMTDSGKTTIQ